MVQHLLKTVTAQKSDTAYNNTEHIGSDGMSKEILKYAMIFFKHSQEE
jgi:hypothetical protein